MEAFRDLSIRWDHFLKRRPPVEDSSEGAEEDVELSPPLMERKRRPGAEGAGLLG